MARALPGADLETILRGLEACGVLRGHEHQRDRYFEIGHDWLAKKVFELREERLREEDRRAELARQRAEADERLDRERKRRRRVVWWAVLAAVLALVMGGLGVFAGVEAHRAGVEARRAMQASRVAGASELIARGRGAWAAKVLLELDAPSVPKWSSLALDMLAKGAPRTTLGGHTMSVQSLAWSPDCKQVATASDDGTVRVFFADGRGRPTELHGHEGALHTIAWSSDGRRLVSSSADGTARVWNVAEARVEIVLRHLADVVDARWSPDSRRVVTASRDHSASVWDLDRLEQSFELLGHLRDVTSASWSPDGRWIVTSSNDCSAMVWDADRPGEPLILGTPGIGCGGEHVGHRGPINRARFSADGRRVVTASYDRTAMVWDLDRPYEPVMLKAHRDWVWDARFSPRGDKILTNSRDRTARVWNADGKSEPVVFYGHGDSVNAAAWSPDGLRIVTAATDSTARVWLATGAGQPVMLWGHEARINDVAFCGEEQVATASDDDTVKVWTGRMWNTEATSRYPSFPRANAAALSPDQTLVLTAREEPLVQGGDVWRFDGTGPVITIRHVAPVTTVAWSPNGARIALGAESGPVRTARADGLGEIVDPEPPSTGRGIVQHLAWAPDSRRLTIAGTTGLEIWDIEGPHRIALIPLPTSYASWSPDGRRLVTSSLGGTVRLLAADGSGEPVVVGKHDGPAHGAVWSPDGMRFVTVSADKTARVWQGEGRGEPLLLRHKAIVTLAAWSHDGRRIVTASTDRIVSVWDLDRAASPSYEPSLFPHEDFVSTAAFTRDDTRVLTISQRAVRAWDLSVAGVAAAVRRINNDCLPPLLRAKYLDERPEIARSRYEACERAEGRTSLLPNAP